MKTLHLAIIFSLLTVFVFLQTALAQTSPQNIMQNDNAPMTKLSSNGTVLIINQTIDKSQFEMGEPIVVHPEMSNVGNNQVFVANGLPLFHVEVHSENVTKVFDSGYSGMLIVGWGFTLGPGMTESDNGTWGSWPKAGAPVIHINTPGKYEILSEANISLYPNSHDFYYNPGHSPLLRLWSIPLEISILPEKYELPQLPKSKILPNQTAVVEIENGTSVTECKIRSCFNPDMLVIKAGTLVTWINHDIYGHTVTSGKPNDTGIGTNFDSGVIHPGESFNQTFSSQGNFSYFDEVRPWITGEIIVSNTSQYFHLPANYTSQINLSPLAQFKAGTAANKVKCNDGLTLLIKAENGSPACVNQQTKEQLLNRGWGIEGFAHTAVNIPSKTNELEIDLANQTYEAGYPVDVNIKNVNQEYGCKIPSVTVREKSNQSLVFGPTPERDYGHSHCIDSWDVTFYAGLENNSLVTKPTRYQIIATLDNMTYQKEFIAMPSNYSGTNISSDSSQVLPGFLTFMGCLPIPNMPPNNGTLISYSGFDLYHRYLAGPDTGGMEFDDYLLRPGQTGSFVMQVHQGQFLPGHNLAGGLSFLSGNLLNVDNSTVWKLNRPVASEDHPGLDVSYLPIFAVAGPDGYATITASISARQDAPQGSYWLYLPPGVCGGHRVLLTVGDKPLSQPPDYIGYDFDSNFVVDTVKQLVFQLINPGIHTFENCTLGYTLKNQTMIVKTFDVIPPGMEYKHIWNATSDQIDKRFLECKSPHITKVYPDMMIDGLPW